MHRKVGPIRHAPWSRWFKTFYVNGWHSHEVQLGPWVVWLAHERRPGQRRIRFHRDRLWRW